MVLKHQPQQNDHGCQHGNAHLSGLLGYEQEATARLATHAHQLYNSAMMTLLRQEFEHKACSKQNFGSVNKMWCNGGLFNSSVCLSNISAAASVGVLERRWHCAREKQTMARRTRAASEGVRRLCQHSVGNK